MTETIDIPAWVELIIREIAIAYPGLDADRLRQVRLKLPRFDSAAGREGWDQYLTSGGDEHFNVGRFLAIVHRIHDERRQRDALAQRHERSRQAVDDSNAHKNRMVAAEELIREMNEDEIAAEWAKIEGKLNAAGRSVFRNYDLAKKRNSAIFKAHVVEMMAE